MKKEAAIFAWSVFATSFGIGIGFMIKTNLSAETVPIPVPPAAPEVSVATLPTSEATPPANDWSFHDPRFTIVHFREDELLGIPLLSETYRISRIRLRKQDVEPGAFYRELFMDPGADGFAVITTQKDGVTKFIVLLGKTTWKGDRGFPWTYPTIRHEVFWDGDQTSTLKYRANGYRLNFTQIAERLVLTDFWEMEDEAGRGENGLLPLHDATAITYYTRDRGIGKITKERVAERLVVARRILQDVRSQALATVPQASGLLRPVDLEWTVTDSGYAACVVSAGVDGRTPITIAVETLMTASDSHLRQIAAHELGHVIRDTADPAGACIDLKGNSDCQMAAEAFALKLMGRGAYRNVQLFSLNKSEKVADELIATLKAINEKFPQS